MNALWLEDQVLSVRTELPCPAPTENEALIRVKMAGICATDLEQLRGYHPFCGIPGHEFVGDVVSAPSSPEWIGRRVVGEINIECGKCRSCKLGRTKHCEDRQVIGIKDRNGCFGEYLVLPLKNLIPVPDSVPDKLAVFTEPIAAAIEILHQVHIQPTDKVLIIGAGRLGQLIVRVISSVPCDLHVVARYKSQRDLISTLETNIIDEKEIPGGWMDVVIEATGSLGGFELARRAVRPEGIMVLKSTYASPGQINLSSIVVDEITMIGSRCGPFSPALALLAEGKINPTDLITGCYPIKAGIQAYHHASEHGAMKVLLEIS